MALFVKAEELILRGFLKLRNDVPSHYTFGRLFRRLDPEQFRTAFQRFMAGFSEPNGSVVRSMARFCAARSIVPVASRHCTWSVLGVVSSG
jgi:hypothetical protein